MTDLKRRKVNKNANGRETGCDTSSNGSQSLQDNKSSGKKGIAPRAKNTKLKVDKIVIHEVDEYTLFHKEDS